MFPTGSNRRVVVASLGMSIGVLAAAFFLIPESFAAEASFRIEPAGAAPTEVPGAIRAKLERDGTRLLQTVDGIDIALCELWWVRNFPSHAYPRRIPDVAYPGLTPGELLGVLYLRQRLEDGRHQELPPGLYTLRYVRLVFDEAEDEAENKDDQNIRDPRSTMRDAVMLIRADWDHSPEDMRNNRLVSLSTRTAGTKRPAVLRLPPLHPAYTSFPAVVSDDLGNCSVQFRFRRSGDSDWHRQLALAIQLFNPPDLSADD